MNNNAVDSKVSHAPLHVKLWNVGPMHDAKLDVKNITMICGANNVGKTYTTYAVYGFLKFFRSYEPDMLWGEDAIKVLLSGEELKVSALECAKLVKRVLLEASKEFSQSEVLGGVFGASDSFFRGAKFDLSIPEFSYETVCNTSRDKEGNRWVGSDTGIHWRITADAIYFSLTQSGRMESPLRVSRRIHLFHLRRALNRVFVDVILNPYIPRAHILCAERTGAVIFQKELDFNRNSLIEMLKGGDSTTSPIYRFFQEYSSCYPLPIKANVNTARDVPEKTKSFLVDRKDKRSRVILDLFAEIIGGDYKMTRGRMKFIPKANQDKRLDMVLSSSSIRALMHMAVYLYFQAKVGDILIIDEPEQNLHPENQRKIARLFALLSNLGVRIFITTHSDYIVREINNLVMMRGGRDDLQRRICSKYGYTPEEFIDAQDVEVCWARVDEQKSKKSTKKWSVLESMKVLQSSGVDSKFFNDTIDEMNEIQTELEFA